MKIPNPRLQPSEHALSLARIVSEDSQRVTRARLSSIKSSKDS